MFELNLLAVFAATISSFILGGLWYSPALFGKAWIAHSGFKQEEAGHPAKVFGLSFVFTLISAIGYGLLVGKSPELMIALHYGLIAGIMVFMCFGINYQFSNKSIALLFIDGGYHFCQFMLFVLAFYYLG